MTLRARLTLWSAGIMAAGLFFSGAPVYSILVISLTRQVDETLASTADEIRQTFRRDVRGVSFSPLALDLTASLYAQVWDADGTRVARNARVLAQPLDAASLAGTRSSYSTVRLEGISLRVLTYPLVTTPEGELLGHLQPAASLQTGEAGRQLV